MASSVRSFGLDGLLAPRELCVILPLAHRFMNVVVNDGRFVPCGSRLHEGRDGNRKVLMIPIPHNDFGAVAIPLMTLNAKNN